VLTIRTDDLDFVHKTKHLGYRYPEINEKLTEKKNVVFN
jgi:hypothetical protein